MPRFCHISRNLPEIPRAHFHWALWAKLNPIMTATRTATLAHRAEVLDDHASDSNHKKGLGIGNLDSWLETDY